MFAKKIETSFVAIAFAEAAEFEAATEYMREKQHPHQIDRVIPSVRPRTELRAPGLRS